MEHFRYRDHFILLTCAVAGLAALNQFNLYGDAFFAFAINGALHATALTLSLRAPDSMVRRCLFVAIAAVLSVLTLYVGILSLVLLAMLPDNARLPAVLLICSVSGGITYGSLVRIFWIRTLTSRAILAIAMVCALATLPAYLAKIYFGIEGLWWLVAVWWLSFSCSLWLFDLKTSARSPAKTL
jgi:hypothetical protein